MVPAQNRVNWPYAAAGVAVIGAVLVSAVRIAQASSDGAGGGPTAASGDVSAAQRALAAGTDKASIDAVARALVSQGLEGRIAMARALAECGASVHAGAVLGRLDVFEGGRIPMSSVEALALLQALVKVEPMAPPEFSAMVKRLSGASGSGSDRQPMVVSVEELSKLDDALRLDMKDYGAWYGIRRALAIVAPQSLPFDRPAARILASYWGGKISIEGVRRQYVEPMASLGSQVVPDLEWCLRFGDGTRTSHNGGIKRISIEALGRIGGSESVRVLRTYLGLLPSVEAREWTWGREGSLVRDAAKSLLRAEPSDKTLDEILSMAAVSPDNRGDFVTGMLRDWPADMSSAAVLVLCKRVLTAHGGGGGWRPCDATGCIEVLGRMGGSLAGDLLVKTLLGTDVAGRPSSDRSVGGIQGAAAKALGTIREFDALPPLLEAAGKVSDPGALAMVAWALGERGDARAVTALERIRSGKELPAPLKTEVAVALVRYGVDYEQNAAIVRAALPDYLPRVGCLHDPQSVSAVARYLDDKRHQRAATDALVAMGTLDAFEALRKVTKVGPDVDSQWAIQLNTGLAGLAKKLCIDSQGEFADAANAIQIVVGWFTFGQRLDVKTVGGPRYEAVRRHADLARKTWLSLTNERLKAVADPVRNHDGGGWMSSVALCGIAGVFSEEVVPMLEKVVAEHPECVTHRFDGGREVIIKDHHTRSLAAKILADKTGRPCTFVDVDGQRRPGGWGLENDHWYQKYQQLTAPASQRSRFAEDY